MNESVFISGKIMKKQFPVRITLCQTGQQMATTWRHGKHGDMVRGGFLFTYFIRIS